MKGNLHNSIDYTAIQFLLSAAQVSQLPQDVGAEVAFIGRSNAGKSSALNALTEHKKLARVSKTPGRTQLINVFVLDETKRLIDLPGYGYAKASREKIHAWGTLAQAYLKQRRSLKGLILVMDIRHPLKKCDQDMLAWCSHAHIPVHVLLTKADKYAQHTAQKTLLAVEKMLLSFSISHPSLQLFSATQPAGVAELRSQLSHWLRPG